MRSAVTTSGKAIVSSKGQVVIPRALRRKLGIHAGEELYFKERPDGIIEIKQLKCDIEMFFGCCKQPKEAPMSVEDMDAAIMQAVGDADIKTTKE